MISRRDFLKMASGAALTAASPSVLATAALQKPQQGERILRFQNIHTGEKVAATYWADGQYIAEELAMIDRVLRDHRSREVAKMDRNLYDLLFALQKQVEKDKPAEMVAATA